MENFRSKVPEYYEPVEVNPDAGSDRDAKELEEGEGTNEDWGEEEEEEEDVQVDENAPIARQDSDPDDPDEISTEILDEVPEVHVNRHRKSSALDDGSGKRTGCRRKHRHRHGGRRASSRTPFDDVTSASGQPPPPPRRHRERKSSRLKESLELLQVQDQQTLRPTVQYHNLLGSVPEGRTAADRKKPVFEMIVAGLIVLAGMFTLLMSVLIGGETWTIVGSSSMGLGSLFLVIGVCWYLAKTKDLHEEEGLEVRVVDARQLAELIKRGGQIRPLK